MVQVCAHAAALACAGMLAALERARAVHAHSKCCDASLLVSLTSRQDTVTVLGSSPSAAASPPGQARASGSSAPSRARLPDVEGAVAAVSSTLRSGRRARGARCGSASCEDSMRLDAAACGTQLAKDGARKRFETRLEALQKGGSDDGRL